MTQQDKDLLEQNGFDVQGALHRFINNDTLYQQLWTVTGSYEAG